MQKAICFVACGEDLKTGIPICNLARVKARGNLDSDKSDPELSKLGKTKDRKHCGVTKNQGRREPLARVSGEKLQAKKRGRLI